MYILFIDESGTPNVKAETPYFILCGLLIDSSNWTEINKKLAAIKNNHNILPEVEIKWRYFNPHNRDKNSPFMIYNTIDINRSESCRNDIYDFLLTDLIEKIIYTAIDLKREKYIKNNKGNLIYKDAYELIFNELYEIIKNNKSKDAMIICDNITDNKNHSIHDSIREHHLSINKNYTSLSNKIIDDLFIVNSKYSAGIQFVDMAAGAISYKYNKNNDEFYNKIKDKLITIDSAIIYVENKYDAESEYLKSEYV
jgi:hypothetical protein